MEGSKNQIRELLFCVLCVDFLRARSLFRANPKGGKRRDKPALQVRFLAILIVVFSHYGTDTLGQGKLNISLNVLVREQLISTNDPGGYFIADHFNQRPSYGITADIALTKRFSIVTGIQRIFFISDVNFWFRQSGNIFLSKSNPYTGVQLPVGLKFNLISNESNSRWRIGAQSGFSFSKFRGTSGGKNYGTRLNQTRTIKIEYSGIREVVDNNFITFDYGFFVKRKLSNRIWLSYNFTAIHSFSDQVVVNNIQYKVISGGTTTDYEANTVATGSARHHTIGIEFVFKPRAMTAKSRN